VIHAVKEFPDIALQNKTWRGAVSRNRAGFSFENIHAFVRAESDTAGKGSWNKCFLENRIQNRKYCVMQDAVADFGFVDVPLLRIMDVKAVITAVAVGLILQIPMELEKVLLDMPLEFGNIRLVFLVRLERFPCREKIFHRYDIREKVAIKFHKS
jgi:hypothetical protein